MWTANSTKADEQLAATRRKFKQALREKEKAWQKNAENTAKLRSLRLAKQAEEKAALIKSEAGKAAGKTKKPSKPRKQ